MPISEIDPSVPPRDWLVHLVRAAALMAEETECEDPGHDAGDDCDACAWDALYQEVPQQVKAAVERAAARPAVQRGLGTRPESGHMLHAIADGSATTSCCGKTPFELPAATHRMTQAVGQVTCPGRHKHVWQAGKCVAADCPAAVDSAPNLPSAPSGSTIRCGRADCSATATLRAVGGGHVDISSLTGWETAGPGEPWYCPEHGQADTGSQPSGSPS